ncbi:hypothetical protein [Microbacterium sp. NPDC087589]|uniref:hypothetical protein n=1 Tax=Microbacterium sp. NPDC087589 TaxID=3364191 RepID=UPI0037F55FF5
MLLELAKQAAAAQPLISDTVAIAIVGGVVTVATAFVTISLTNGHARRQVEDAAREARRTEARLAITEFVTAGIAWAKANDGMVPVYYKEARNQTFWVEWVDTDSGTKIRNDMETVTRTGAQLRLLVGDAELLAAIQTATELVQDGKAMSALIGHGSETGGDFEKLDGRMADAFAYFRDVVAAFQRVETVAARYVSGELAKKH